MKKFGIHIKNDDILTDFARLQNNRSAELYDWQNRAIDFFFKHRRAIFSVSTGAGKTYCAIEIIKQLQKREKDIQTLIVVPKNVILEDTWFKELYENGFSLSDIGVFYAGIKEYAKITITNMQNIHKLALDIFDLVIFDEIHNYGSERMIQYLDRDYKYMIGLSATIERQDNAHLKILDIFNYNIFNYTPAQALQDGILNAFNYTDIAIELDDETMFKYQRLTSELNLILMAGGGYNKLMLSNEPSKFAMLAKMNERKKLLSNYPRKFDVVKLLVKKHEKDKIIIFNSYNEQTSKCYWQLLDIGIKSRVVHSYIEKQKRDEALKLFKIDKINVLLTSKVLDEGYNLPAIDTGIIMAGDSSERQTIQRMGRVLRRKEKSSNLYQIYCKNTIEHDHAIERSKIFKQLCSRYDDYIYTIKGEMV